MASPLRSYHTSTHPRNHAFPAYKYLDVSSIPTSPVKHSNVLAPNKLTLILAFNFWTARRRMLRTVYTVPCEGNTLKRRSKICPVSCECSLIQPKWYRCITGILRWSYELGEFFTDVHYHMLGTLSNYDDDDDDDNNNVKKQLVLWPQQLCTCITLFSTFLWSPLHDYDVKPANATFYGGRGHTTTDVPFSIWTWI